MQSLSSNGLLKQEMAVRLLAAVALFCSSIAPAFGVLDLDGDGLSDLWQRRYGAEGLPAAGDADGDGVTNGDESELASNPFDPESYFGLRSYQFREDEQIAELTFHVAPGNLYEIQSSPDMRGDNWRVEKRLIGSADGVFTVSCLFEPGSEPNKFYRVRLATDDDGDGLTAWEERLLGLSDSDANSNGEKGGGDMAWVVDRLYSSEPLELTDGTVLEPSPPSMEEISRFLNQATFGMPYEAIEAMALSGMSFGKWIDEQMALPVTKTIDSIAAEQAAGEAYERSLWTKAWWRNVMTGEDQLRQRVAFALSEILVISGKGVDIIRGEPIAAATYYDHLIEHAFGNYGELLEDVTMNISMGLYLGHFRNRKAIALYKIFPDENYAREVMQLFSIGLWELNRDGSHKLDDSGNSIPSYTNYHIEELAKVMTGFNWGGTWSFEAYKYTPDQPMTIWEDQHDRGEKHLVNGGYIPAQQEPIQDVRDALDNLARHPNTGPFIGRLLIQRLVTSNPSPGYIERVANAYFDNGSGEVGDMGAVVRAILLDPEARSPAGLTDDHHGKMREPYITYVQLARAFDYANSKGSFPVSTINGDDQLGQVPLSSPTVFNYFLPDHQPAGEIIEAGLYAPEFQILNSLIVVEWPNLLRRAIRRGLDPWYMPAGSVLQPDFSEELAILGDGEALIDRLDLMFTYGTLTAGSRALIQSAMNDWALTDEEKVWIAVYLVMTSPEYVILR